MPVDYGNHTDATRIPAARLARATRRPNMNCHALRGLFMGFALALILPGAPAFAAGDTRIEAAGRPVVVQQVLAAKYPGWTVAQVTRMEDKGPAQFKVRLTDNTIEIDVILDEGGHIVEAARGVGVAVASRSKPKKGGKGEEDDGDESKGPDLYGYAQVFYRHAFSTGSDGVVDNDNFRVQRVRLGIKGDINSWASYVVEIDPRAPEVSGILRDAYLRLDVIPNHQIRIGQQKTQFGYENRESSSELFAVNRAELSDSLSRGLNLRDIGVGIIGHYPINDTWRIEDALTIVNGAGMNVQDDDTSTKNFWGRVGVRHRTGKDSWERLGFSAGKGDFIDVEDPADPADDILTDFQRWGVDLEIDRKWFFFSSEYVRGDEKVSLVEDPGAGIEEDKPDGYYFNLVGKTPWHVGPILRYDVFSDTFERYTIGAYYGEPKDKIRVLLNYEYRKKFEDALGNVGRGDDKLYLWTQVRF
jgi:hypothetical protein